MSTDNINTSSWERIQKGFQETERLLGQKRYNECMIRAETDSGIYGEMPLRAFRYYGSQPGRHD